MTDTYTEARKRGDTQGQRRAAERAKRDMNKALLAFAPKGKKKKIKQVLGLG